MAQFGEKLRNARERMGITQQTLADRIFVTRQTISRWETGERYPDLLMLKKLSSLLNVSVDELLDDREMPVVVEKNPIIEKPFLNNLIIVLYALVVFTYAFIAVATLPSVKDIISSIQNGDGYIFFQLIAEIGEIILLSYGLVMAIEGKMNADRTGYITSGFFGFEVFRVHGFLILEKKILPVFIMIPYLIGVISSYLFYIKKDSRLFVKLGIVAASAFGIFRTGYSLYTILLYADHLYTSMNSWSGFLTVLIYVLFIYQMFVLNYRRRQAKELADLKAMDEVEWYVADIKEDKQ